MPNLSDFQTVKKLRMIDLVDQAGIDVSDWGKYKNGKKSPGANPKYCYEWAFLEPGKMAVLTLWYHELIQNGDDIDCKISSVSDSTKYQNWKQRSERRKTILSTALNSNLPLRVIIVKSYPHNSHDKKDITLRVKTRLLDKINWGIVSINQNTGEILIRRGFQSDQFVDQFSIEDILVERFAKHEIIQTVFSRSSDVRRLVLLRAKGKCEYCGAEGFKLQNGKIFLETHHIIPLSEKGPDDFKNVAAFCPNHHREAHYGETADFIRNTLQNSNQ
ncbi:MAG: HNH endonuclease signature motif containing protein [Chloroflexota bacterium]